MGRDYLEVMRVSHEFGPYYQADSKILILGSFPSLKSRAESFYYMHPQNRFWKVLAQVFECEVPLTIEEKKEFLNMHHIALWDVVESCEIKNSSDATIKNVIPTDLSWLLSETKITHIFTTGKKAYTLYQKYSKPLIFKEAIELPSTSSANIANYSLEDLVQKYNVLNKL